MSGWPPWGGDLAAAGKEDAPLAGRPGDADRLGKPRSGGPAAGTGGPG